VIGATQTLVVFAYRAAVDLRKSYDGLCALVTQGLGRDVLSGELYLFINKKRRRAKVLYFDGTGLCLLAKRLETGSFAAPWERSGEGPLRLTMSELMLWLEGSEVVGRMRISPPPWTPGERAVRWG
jgi:transposase